ncbi:EnvZ/OmpR regulon moderator MzrA [Erwinia sorbitola]|uniref:Modulator protein MzrA n=1 Tax=Erwinia sorbitola TaxID=2681984 RepID=A0A6I6EVD8_9GAMM|nr:EnvZ/OmpR regulon moderator MzrA [Erwinia sorbitola]MTD27541.1 EnvZ/OmpR regulon moderator MzrA [Erwinia sorbitola]QGU89079.1 EnvZ/OmpR regulon moderator MzrA [Erwinia sorbitola]
MPGFIKLSSRTLRLLPLMTLAALALVALALMPALFRSESSLHIRASRHGTTLPDGFYVYQTLSAQGIHIKSITPEQDSLVIKFDSMEQSDAAEKVLRKLLPYGFDIARQQGHGAANWINRISFSSQSVG